MNRVFKLKNIIQTYAWGSKTAISDLMGIPSPTEHPQAELWMGAHPKAPSKIFYRDKWVSLPDMIKHHPAEILGNAVARRFGAKLPFLLKVLAAERPLSIQAHPDLIQAQKGFERENRQGIPLDADHRTYRDDNHKPECICALTPFLALKGFRPVLEITNLMETNFPGDFIAEKKILNSGNEKSIKTFFRYLMTMDEIGRSAIINKTVSRAENISNPPAVIDWIIRLHRAYPGDIGLLSPLFLNLVRLEPGQAMYLPAGELHAYLEGTAIELMASSDNVMRGGLTEKYIDVPELISTLTFIPQSVQILKPRPISSSETVYDGKTEDFMLSSIRVDRNTGHESSVNRNVEILMCTKGRAVIRWQASSGEIKVTGGESVLIPAAVIKYDIEGDAVFYKASVPVY
jgi:mannose-6-phosphate isomerase